MADYVMTLGFVAATLTISAFLPQVIKAWKTKSTKDVSLLMFSTLIVGNVLWLVYGILIGSLPIVITNILIFIFASTILILKIKYK
ncbi:hypothetical protein CMO87_01610 [Candidatus Woesearchaeota archaeon]|jgi:MtN3 and saliva related transmembrane protein|nr:hypothetical protein [Candidatus Woesearchaeota archaeon]